MKTYKFEAINFGLIRNNIEAQAAIQLLNKNFGRNLIISNTYTDNTMEEKTHKRLLLQMLEVFNQNQIQPMHLLFINLDSGDIKSISPVLDKVMIQINSMHGTKKNICQWLVSGIKTLCLDLADDDSCKTMLNIGFLIQTLSIFAKFGYVTNGYNIEQLKLNNLHSEIFWLKFIKTVDQGIDIRNIEIHDFFTLQEKSLQDAAVITKIMNLYPTLKPLVDLGIISIEKACLER